MSRIVIGLLLFMVSGACQRSGQPSEMISLTGITMGKIGYSIKYYHPSGTSYKQNIDTLLKQWNQVLSTYIPDSEISRFNRDSCHTFESPYFYPVLRASDEVYSASGGAFDPTVGPLVNAWGFGPDVRYDPDSSQIDSLRKYIGFDKVVFDEHQVCKQTPGLRLDFSAIAKGYAVDVVAAYLEEHGVGDYLVEIGGEVICKGTKAGGKPWRTAIEHPAVEVYERKLYAIAEVENTAIATSGNYRNYYMKNGRKMVHTIDPNTGYPVDHQLLSATVFAESCMKADAWATAFMVMGLEKAKAIVDANPHLRAYFIYVDDAGELATYASAGIEDAIKLVDVEN